MFKVLAVVFVLVPFGCGSSPRGAQAPAHTGSATHASAPTISNDPESVIHHCGRPDRVADSVFVQPGNSITSRSLTYSKAHLQITYISSAPDDPQQWGFSGLVDTTTNHALGTGDLQTVLEKRLPCAFTNGAVAQSAERGR